MSPGQGQERLGDVLGPGLWLVLIGTAAGHRSAALGQYYAGPGNRFWPTLHEVGLTPRLMRPDEYRELPSLGIGLTDLHKTGVGPDTGLDQSGYKPGDTAHRLRSHRPAIIAFTSKKAASIWLERPTGAIAYGACADPRGVAPCLFVLPSPSGAARRFWTIGPWQALSRACRHLPR